MENPLKALEKRIKQARWLIEEGVRVGELREAVDGMVREYFRMEREQEREGRKAWKWCWGIWGVGRGQEWAWEVPV